MKLVGIPLQPPGAATRPGSFADFDSLLVSMQARKVLGIVRAPNDDPRSVTRPGGR